MGQRVDASNNEVTSVEFPQGHVLEAEAVFCANCGDPGSETSPPQGYAPVVYAEDNWIDVGRELTCGIYCAAKCAGLDEKDAQLARAAKTQLELRAQGLDEEADADKEWVEEIAANSDAYPFVPALEEVATEDTRQVDTTPEESEGESLDWDQLVKDLGLKGGER
jgi:hypothetical protein